MQQIRYSFGDILRNKRLFISQFILILVVNLLLGYCVHTYLILSDTKRTAEKLLAANDTYITTDVTDIETYISKIATSEAQPRLAELYAFMNQYDHYVLTQISTLLVDSVGNAEIIQLDRKAFEVFNLYEKCDDIDPFLLFEAHQSELIPVIAGYKFAREYDIGDVLGGEYEIAGFFDRGAYCIRPSAQADKLYFDTALVRPCIVNKHSQYSELASAIIGMHIITDDPDVLSGISEKSNELDLFSLRFISISGQITRIFEQELRVVKYMMTYILLSMLLSLACMASSMLVFIKKHIREFAIHLLCGATMNHIMLRILLQAGVMYAFAFAITSLLFFDLAVALWLALICVVFCLCAAILPIAKLYRVGLNGMLKRSE